ncbi:hypothetical protein ASPZODRAFT_146204 [Penicilliopsis zonata CBS 506.65]|uniref:Uncharacterized protein n=1 Tax=Penicilliopsis zonata CBS 506.65 TaxID=1073090 RepID=A0A1L9S7P7_9EURO|nr:hypothetical protein ASPZODRAFT_146204 [Penicilliopsis zonata CBS 506.65]OJJ43183.1 hypothetical protein ASPZODRAFT_146204 [Penicilliopsis zonata CBS 506.65]
MLSKPKDTFPATLPTIESDRYVVFEVHPPDLFRDCYRKTACIDVSGAKGEAGTDKQKNGQAGGNGGSIWLYIEEPSSDLSTKLSLKAYGGDGGHGMNQTADSKDSGGDGGNGGLCGDISCYLGYGAVSYGRYLYKATSQTTNWGVYIKDIATDLTSNLKSLAAYGISQTIIEEWNSTVTDHANLAAAGQKLRTSLDKLIDEDSLDPDHVTPSQPTLQSAHKLLETLKALFDTHSPPCGEIGLNIGDFNNLADSCDSFSGAREMEQALQESLQSVMNAIDKLIHGESADPSSAPFKKHLEKMLDELRDATQRFRNILFETVCESAGGQGGAGGTGATLNIANGNPGKTQPDKPTEVQVLSFDGLKADCYITQACVFPEQCQMILELADNLYFTNDLSKCRDAAVLYSRLTRRLKFLDVLVKEKEVPLAKAYSNLEYRYEVTVESQEQLLHIYTAAQLRLNQLFLGQDLFCHAKFWVPRLSMTFYEGRVHQMLNHYALVTAAYKKYSEDRQREQILNNHISNLQQSNQATLQAARSQINSMTGPGGELDTIGITIVQYSPQMAQARRKLADELADLKGYMEATFEFSMDSFMDALSVLSMAPHGLTAAVQGVNVAYKSWTTKENMEGNPVKKQFIVSQLDTCTGSVKSLVETYKHLDTGELAVDDPGYAKIVTTTDTFLLELSNILKTCAGVSQRLGERALKLNPQLPAIYYWIKRMKASLEFDIMQRLNYQGRALAFWGPMDIQGLISTPSELLDRAIGLSDVQNNLENKFEECYGKLQQGAWNFWPASRELNHPGLLIDITDDVLDDLKQKPDTFSNAVEAIFTITPHSLPAFSDMANVRLTQVRLWLLGATVSQGSDGKSFLRVELHHMGRETIWDIGGTPYQFSHDPVHLQFVYDTNNFNKNMKASGDPELVQGRQAIENDYAMVGKPTSDDRPPLGPFTDWRIQIRADANQGMDLLGLTKVWVEFCGRNLPADGKLKELS